jgi:hypothetical protein
MKSPEQILREYTVGEILIDLGEGGTQLYTKDRFEALCGLLRSDLHYDDLCRQRELESLLRHVGRVQYALIRTTIKNFIYSTKWKNTKVRAEKWVHDFFDARNIIKFEDYEEIVRGLWLRAREVRKTAGAPVTKLVRDEIGEYRVAWIGHKVPLNSPDGSQHILAEFDPDTREGKTVCGRYHYFMLGTVEQPPYCFRCWELADPTPANPLADVPLDIMDRLPDEGP